MYPWSNENTLQTLRVQGENDVLLFEVGSEKAEVHLKDADIEKVVVQGTEITKDQAYLKVVGEGNTQRDVYHYLNPGGPTPTLRLGITQHKGAGTWSSLPHDFELRTEPGFEEAFFHLLQGGPERAFQVGRGVWSDGTPVDTIWPVRDHAFSTIPMGYHPVVGEPEVYVRYVWAYVAKKPEWEKVTKEEVAASSR